MISYWEALLELEGFFKDIPKYYSHAYRDYRGKEIGVRHVEQYLASEKYRFAEIANFLPQPTTSNHRLLDVGIAYGFLSVLIQNSKAWKCEGLELEENIPVYCAFAKQHQIPIHMGKLGVKPLAFSDESFGGILFSEVLEHLRLSPQTVLREFQRLLVKGGYLVITTPNMARLSHILKLIVGKNPLEPFPDDPLTENITERVTHIREYTMDELKELVHQAGFKVVKIRYSNCMERSRRLLGWATSMIPFWRGNLMILAQK